MLAYCDYSLLKDENSHEVNCDADFHFQAFHQKCTIHECNKLAPFPVYSGLSHILPKSCSPLFSDELLYNFYSLHIHQCNILSANRFLLQATRLHVHISNTRVARKLLKCCLWVTGMQLASTCYLVTEMYRIYTNSLWTWRKAVWEWCIEQRTQLITNGNT